MCVGVCVGVWVCVCGGEDTKTYFSINVDCIRVGVWKNGGCGCEVRGGRGGVMSMVLILSNWQNQGFKKMFERGRKEGREGRREGRREGGREEGGKEGGREGRR